jgi:hypothetical protein
MAGVWMNCQEKMDAELSMQIDIKSHEFIRDFENTGRIMMTAAEMMKNTIGLLGRSIEKPDRSLKFMELTRT